MQDGGRVGRECPRDFETLKQVWLQEVRVGCPWKVVAGGFIMGITKGRYDGVNMGFWEGAKVLVVCNINPRLGAKADLDAAGKRHVLFFKNNVPYRVEDSPTLKWSSNQGIYPWSI